MNFHILTIETRRTRISVDRGFLVSQVDQEEKRLPLEEIKALLIAVPQVSFTNQAISRLLENNVTILHCSESYQPIGFTVGIERTVYPEIIKNQVNETPEHQNFKKKLWKKIIQQKIKNQIFVLENFKVIHDLSSKDLEKAREANAARKYWEEYFKFISRPLKREHRNAINFENKALNYGYAVIQTLVHRNILIHGLLSCYGLKHELKHKSEPLVYDLIEPIRPFIDLFLANFLIKFLIKKEEAQEALTVKSKTELILFFEEEEENCFKEWIKYLMNSLQFCRLKARNKSYKLVDYIDLYVSSISKGFMTLKSKDFEIPNLVEAFFDQNP